MAKKRAPKRRTPKKQKKPVKPAKAKRSPPSLAGRPGKDFERQFEKRFEKRMEEFGEEMGQIGLKFGERMEHKGRQMENWWRRTFGFVGPFFSSILSVILVAVMIWVLTIVNLPFGSMFISNVGSFVMNNLAVFFAFFLFFSYTSYFHKWHRRAYIPFSPVIVAAGVTIGFWLFMWALNLINLSFSNPVLTSISMLIQSNILGIFITFLFLGYLGLIIWTMMGKLDSADLDGRGREEGTMAERRARIRPGVKRLYRSGEERILGGVCGGIAEYLEVDPVVIRLLWVIFSLVYGTGILAYIIAWIIIPRNPGHKWG